MRGSPSPLCSRRPPSWSIPARAGEPPARPPAPCMPTVYPRACGGTAASERGIRSQECLSPRVRGNRLQVAIARPHQASIPAGAGEPYGQIVLEPNTEVYPHACGGTGTRKRPSAVPVHPGLSPRVRGNPLDATHVRYGLPTWALSPRVRGNHATKATDAEVDRRVVYPRPCGGTAIICTGARIAMAWVYPRACGGTLTHRSNRALVPSLGSIPARAGEPVCRH